MHLSLKSHFFATTLIIAGTAAMADPGYYYGGGLSFSRATSLDDFGSESTDTSPALGLTFGYRFENGNAFFGPEADIDLFFGSEFEFAGTTCAAGGAAGPYYCTRDAVIRLRGIYGQSLDSGLEWFGSGGVGFMVGDGAIGPGSTDRGLNAGFTLGLGLQKTLGRGMLRGEVIYDRFDTSLIKPSDGINEYQPDYEATTLKVSYIISF